MRRSLLMCLFAFVSCRALPPGAEAWSLDGRALFPVPLGDERMTKLAADRDRAAARFEASPDDLEAIVWLGRRTAYLGRYREAIEIYTRGMRTHPNAPELYRHRGHRLISTRQLDAAIADFKHAAELIEGTEDVVEPDGIPNARNQPTSTLQFNIWYHLGLACHLKGDHQAALDSYQRCLRVSRNPDALCATTHWLWITLRRLGRDAEADAVLEPIHADLDVIENHSYHRCLLLYKGELRPEAVLGGDGSSGAAAKYGVGNWYIEQGEAGLGRAMLRDLLAATERQWASFGYLAAEADLLRHGAL